MEENNYQKPDKLNEGKTIPLPNPQKIDINKGQTIPLPAPRQEPKPNTEPSKKE